MLKKSFGRSDFGIFPAHFGTQNCPKIGPFFFNFGLIFWITFWTLFGLLLEPILGSILGPERQRGGKMSPRNHQELQRPKKLHLQKPAKTFSFLRFWGPEASQESLKRPKKAPKRHPKNSKTPKKGIQHWTQKLTNFGPIFGQWWVPKWAWK